MSKRDPVGSATARKVGEVWSNFGRRSNFQKLDFRAFSVCRHLAAPIPAVQGYAHVGDAAFEGMAWLVGAFDFCDGK